MDLQVHVGHPEFIGNKSVKIKHFDVDLLNANGEIVTPDPCHLYFPYRTQKQLQNGDFYLEMSKKVRRYAAH